MINKGGLSGEEQSELAEQIKRGNPAAETKFVQTFNDRVFVMILSRVRDRESAREVTQEVLMSAVNSLRNGQVRRTENLAGFVYGTARNLANNHLRSISQQREEPLDWDFPLAAPEENFETTERLRLVHKALDQMEALDRKVLLLTLIDGMKPGEIGGKLGLTSEVVRQRKSRALKKVIERIQQLSQKVIPMPPRARAT